MSRAAAVFQGSRAGLVLSPAKRKDIRNLRKDAKTQKIPALI